MKSLTKQAWIVLPALVLMSLAAWVFFGALIGQGAITADTLAWLAELPFASAWALAVLVGAMTAMHVTGANIPNARRDELMQRAEAGDPDAYRALILESCCWLAAILLSALVFWLVRR